MMTLYVIIMRTIVDIPNPILDELDELAKREAISRAEAVRRAMAEYVERRRGSSGEAAFGIWKSRKVDALTYEDDLRGEWSR
jgi:metal-responsive CopG/Arc/MetJ family transcriptional regulator